MDSLPPEVITQILDYLCFEDRQQMSLVNTVWNYASMHPTLLRKEFFVFKKCTNNLPNTMNMVTSSLPNYNDFKKILLESKRCLFNIKLQFKSETAHLEDITIFFNLGIHLKHLCLEDLKWLSDSFFSSIIIYCKSLKSLILKRIHCLTITEKTQAPLLSLNYLTFERVALSDMSFNMFIKCFPNLKDIGILYCQMLVWPQAIKRFYPNYRDQAILTNYNSKDVFTDVNFISFLKTDNCIKSLRLVEYPHILLHLPDKSKLHRLTFDSVRTNGHIIGQTANINIYISVLSKQTALQQLDIVCCSCCSLLSVIPKLVYLKYLTVYVSAIRHPQCLPNTVTFVKHFLSSLSCNKHLRSLAIKHDVVQYPGELWEDIFEIPDCVLKSLTTLISPIGNSLQLINLGKPLICLEIENGEILTADDLKLLFKNLTNLRKLVINHCYELNDAILAESPISNIKGLVDLGINNGNLTYQCFPFIKLMDLKILHICGISLGHCIHQQDMTDFENGLKEFGSYVPALTTLQLEFTAEDYLDATNLGFNLLDYLSKHDKFISYFRILKHLIL